MFDELTEVKMLEKNENFWGPSGKSRGVFRTQVSFFVKIVKNLIVRKNFHLWGDQIGRYDNHLKSSHILRYRNSCMSMPLSAYLACLQPKHISCKDLFMSVD